MSAAARARDLLWHLGVAALAVFLTALHVGATVAYVPLDRLARFTAFEPFQHRVLVPALVATLRTALPGLAVPVVYALLEIAFWVALVHLADAALVRIAPPMGRTARRLLAFTATWPVAVHLVKPQSFELVHADGTLCRVEAFDLNFAHINLAPNLYYPYDLPAAVLTLAIVLLAWRLRDEWSPMRIAAYLLTVAVASLNRESAAVAVLAAAALVPARPKGRYWALLSAHLAIALAVSAFARVMVAPTAAPNPHGGPAGPYELHLANNLRTLLHPLYVVWIVPLFAGGLWLPLAAFRRALARDQSKLLILFVVPSIALALVFGQILEGRIFIEVQPVLWLAAVETMATVALAKGAIAAPTPDARR